MTERDETPPPTYTPIDNDRVEDEGDDEERAAWFRQLGRTWGR